MLGMLKASESVLYRAVSLSLILALFLTPLAAPTVAEAAPPEEDASSATGLPSSVHLTPAQDVQISKTLVGQAAPPGLTMQYKLDFYNNSTSTAQAVVITDTLPTSMTYESWYGYAYNPGWVDLDQAITPTIAGSQVSWALGDMVSNGYGSIYLTGRVIMTANPGQTLTNTATISTSSPDPDPNNNVYTHTTTVAAPTYDMRIRKWVSGNPGPPGGEMLYTLYFRNDGNVLCEDVVLTDTLPVSLSYNLWYGFAYNPGLVDLDQTITPTISGQQIVWPLGDIVVGGYGYINLSSLITDAISSGRVVTNMVEISGNATDTNPSNNIYTHTVAIAARTRDLHVSKSSAGVLLPGHFIEYTIAYGNRGNWPAQAVLITDSLPAGVNYVSHLAPDFNTVITGSTLVLSRTELAGGGSGSILLVGRITDTASSGEVLTNVVTISSRDPDVAPDDNSYTHTVAIISPTQDLGVVKTIYGDPPPPGGPLQYLIYFQNIGNQPAPNVVITDTLPASLTYTAWSGYAYNPNWVDLDQTITPTIAGNQVIWNMGDIVDGGYGYLYLNGLVSPTASIGQVLTNVIAISSSAPDISPPDNAYTHTTMVVTPTQNMIISKSLDTIPAPPGAQMRYRIDFYNTGNWTAHNVHITDTLPTSLTYSSWSGIAYNPPNWVDLDQTITPTIAGGQVSWAMGDWSPNSYGSVYLAVRVSDTASVGQVLTNTVTISSSELDIAPGDNTSVYTTSVAMPRQDVYVSKSWSGAARPGRLVEYTITFGNQAVSTAHDVVITDTLPASLTYSSWSGYINNPNWVDLDQTITPTISGQSVIWPVGNLTPGSFGHVYLSARITDTVHTSDVLTNVVQIATDDTDLDPSNNAYTATLSIVAPTQDLSITKSINGNPAPPGGQVWYQISFRNDGNWPAQNVVVSDTLPISLTYTGWYGYAYNPDWVDLDQTITPTVVGQVLTWNLGNVVDGGYGYLYLGALVTTTASAGESLTNVARISTSDGDIDLTDNVYTHTFDVVAPIPNVYVNKSSSGLALPGQEVQYHIIVGNQGSANAHGILVTDTLPANAAYVSHDAPGFTTLATGHDLILSRPEVSAGQSYSVYLTVRVTNTASSGDVLTNVVTASTSDADIDLSNNLYTHTLSVSAPTRDVYVTKALSGNPAPPGGQMEYSLFFRNSGNWTAQNVIITDILPVSLTYVSWYGHAYNPDWVDLDQTLTPTLVGNQVAWPLGDLAAGGYGYIYLTVHITSAASTGDILTNVVEASTSDEDNQPSNNTYTYSVPVSGFVQDLAILKSLSGEPAPPGGQMQYRLLFQNNGSMAAPDVMLTDTLPVSLTYVDWSGYAYNPNWMDLGQALTPTFNGGQIVWPLGTLEANAYGYVYLTVSVTDTAGSGEALTNVATIENNNPDANPVDNTSSYATHVATATQDVHVTKSLVGSPPAPGGPMQYQIYFQNQGNAAAQAVIITDTLPASLTYNSWSGYAYNPDWVDLDQTITPIIAGNQVIWNVGSLATAGYGYLFLTVNAAGAATPGGLLTNVVAISTADSDMDPSDNVYTHTSAITAPFQDVYVSKTSSGQPLPGRQLQYNILFGNQGNAAAHNVLITDSLPASLAYVSHSAPGFTTLSTGGVLALARSEVAAGESGTVYLTVHISDTASAGDLLTNSISITTGDADVDPADNRYTHTLPIAPLSQDVRVIKSLSGQAAPPGGTMQYSLFFSNDGNGTAHNVIITDTLPSALTYTAWSGYAYSPDWVDLDQSITPTIAGQQVIWNVGDLTASGYGYIYLTVHVADGAAAGQGLTNIAAISTGDVDIEPSDNTYTHTSAVAAPVRDLAVSKSLAGSSAPPGGIMQYQIYFRNDGNSNAQDVTLTDTLPVSLTYTGWYGYAYNPAWVDLDQTLTPTLAGNQISWPLGDLAAGGYGYLYLSGRVSDVSSQGQVLTNVVTISSSDADSDPADNRFTHTAGVASAQQDVYVSKGVGGVPLAGQLAQYTIVYGNQAASTAHGIIITDSLPANVTYISHTAAGFTTISTGGQLALSRPALSGSESGEIYVTVRVSDTAAVGDVLTNIVEISSVDYDLQTANNIYTHTTSVGISTQDVQVSKALSGKPGSPGGQMEYRLEFRNDGNSSAQNVSITDTLPVSLAYTGWYGYAYNPAWVDLDQTITPTIAGNQIVWAIGELAAGSYGVIYLSGRVTDAARGGQVVTNVVQISTSDPDSLPPNNAYTHTATLAIPTSNVYVSKSSNDQALPGQQIQYAITFGNQAGTPAYDVVVTDSLPSNVSYVSHNAPGFTTVMTGSQVVLSRPNLDAGSSGVIYLTVRVADMASPGNVLVNRVRISTGEADSDPSDNTYTHTMSVAAFSQDMRVLKALSGAPPSPGGQLQYSIFFRNDGSATAHAVILTDTLPVSLTYLAWHGYAYNPDWVDLDQVITPTMAGQQVVWPLNNVVAGGYGYLYLTTQVSDTAAVGGMLTNQVKISTSDPDSDLGNNADTHTIPLGTPTHDVRVVKTLSGQAAPPGGQMWYQIDFYNDGNVSAPDVVITDTLPASLTYASWYGYAYNPAWVDLNQVVTPSIAGQSIRWEIGALATGGYGVIYLGGQVADTAVAGQVVTNSVEISTSAADSQLADNTYTYSATVVPPTRDLQVSKSLNSCPQAAGGEVEYRISFRNNGNAPAQAVVITDTLPVSLSYVSSYNNAGFVATTMGHQVVFTSTQVDSGQSGELYLRVRLTDSLQAGGMVTNRVAIASAHEDLNNSDNAYTHTFQTAPQWGGPDGFGYVFKDNLTPGGPVFDWIDATDGANLTLSGDNETSGPLALGFDFPYYGQSYTALYVSTNGLISLGEGSSAFANTCLPRPDPPNALLAVMWDDLLVAAPQAIYTKTGGLSPHRYYVVEWHTVARLDEPASTLTFEAILYEDGLILFQYLDLAGNLNSSTVGIEDENGELGLQYLYDRAGLFDRQVIAFLPPDHVPLSGVSVTGPTTGRLDVAYTFTATTSPLTPTLPLAYTWSPAPDSGQGTPYAVYTWSSAGLKTITVSLTARGSSVAATHTITIAWSANQVPVEQVAINGPANGQIGVATTFTAAVSPLDATTPITYTWDPPPDSGQGTPVVTYTWATSGVKSIAITAWNEWGSANDAHSIQIGLMPVCTALTGISIHGPTQAVTGTAYTFTSTVNPPTADSPMTYTWSPEPDSGQGTPAAQYTWAVSGVQAISLTVSNCDEAGTASDDHTIQVFPGQVAVEEVNISGPTSGYVSVTYIFTATVSPTIASPPITYTWNPAPDSGQGTAVVAYTWNSVGIKSIVVTAWNEWGSDSGSHSIQIDEAPACTALTGVSIHGPDQGLTGVAATFTSTVNPSTAGLPIVYTWSPEPASGQGGPMAQYIWTAGGAQTISLTVSNCAGTGTANDTHTLQLTTSQVGVEEVHISGPASGVVNTAYTFTATVSPPTASLPITYTWNPPPASGQGQAVVAYTWAISGLKSITVTAWNAWGQASGAHSIDIQPTSSCTPLTGVSIHGPEQGFISLSYAFTATVSPPNAAPPFVYTWAPPPASGQGTSAVQYAWTAVGNQTISLTVSNCAGSAVRNDEHIIAIAYHKIFLPMILRNG